MTYKRCAPCHSNNKKSLCAIYSKQDTAQSQTQASLSCVYIWHSFHLILYSHVHPFCR